MASQKASVKKRNWAFFVYPTKEQLEAIGSKYDGADGYGSVPEDWRKQLQLSGLQYAISPLHDKDELEDGSGKIKKPHYHIIVVYGSPTTYSNVKSMTDRLNSPAPQALEQIRGYYRYLTHKDNPEKYQYDDCDIVTGGGFDISDFVEITKSEVNAIKSELLGIIKEHNFLEYCDLIDYVQENKDKVYFDVASSNTIFFNTYLKSKRYGQMNGTTKMSCSLDGHCVVVDENGEVIK